MNLSNSPLLARCGGFASGKSSRDFCREGTNLCSDSSIFAALDAETRSGFAMVQ